MYCLEHSLQEATKPLGPKQCGQRISGPGPAPGFVFCCHWKEQSRASWLHELLHKAKILKRHEPESYSPRNQKPPGASLDGHRGAPGLPLGEKWFPTSPRFYRPPHGPASQPLPPSLGMDFTSSDESGKTPGRAVCPLPCSPSHATWLAQELRLTLWSLRHLFSPSSQTVRIRFNVQ